MTYHNLSAATFADTIAVQRSSISHILSGRNKPSLDFIIKITDAFKDVDIDWLLKGKGTFPKTEHTSSSPTLQGQQKTEHSISEGEKEIETIIVFYTDGTFKNFTTNNNT